MNALRYDKICREVGEKEEGLAKARVDLKTELQTSGSSFLTPVGNPSAVVSCSVHPAEAKDEVGDAVLPSTLRAATSAAGSSTRDLASNAPPSPRRDAPWLESLGLGQVSAYTVGITPRRVDLVCGSFSSQSN